MEITWRMRGNNRNSMEWKGNLLELTTVLIRLYNCTYGNITSLLTIV